MIFIFDFIFINKYCVNLICINKIKNKFIEDIILFNSNCYTSKFELM